MDSQMGAFSPQSSEASLFPQHFILKNQRPMENLEEQDKSSIISTYDSNIHRLLFVHIHNCEHFLHLLSLPSLHSIYVYTYTSSMYPSL